MTRLIETLQDMLHTIARTWPELGKTAQWFDGYKAGLEASIQSIRMSLEVSKEVDALERAQRLNKTPVKYEVLSNMDPHERLARGLVDAGGLIAGDVVHIYQYGELLVDEQGCFTWLVTEEPKCDGESNDTVKLTRLRFDALKNWGNAMRRWGRASK